MQHHILQKEALEEIISLPPLKKSYNETFFSGGEIMKLSREIFEAKFHES